MAERIDVEEARRKVTRGEGLLVCAYEDQSKCDRIKLDGAISLQAFRQRENATPHDREIIFYCA